MIYTGPWILLWRITFQRGIYHIYQYDEMPWKPTKYKWPFVRRIHKSTVDSLHKGPGTRNFDFFPLVLNRHSSCRWFETPTRPMWRNTNVVTVVKAIQNRLIVNIQWKLANFYNFYFVDISGNKVIANPYFVMSSQWASWSLKPPANPWFIYLFALANIK